MRIVIQYYVEIVSYKEGIMISPIVMIVENFQFIKTNIFILQANFAPKTTGISHLFIIKLPQPQPQPQPQQKEEGGQANHILIFLLYIETI